MINKGRQQNIVHAEHGAYHEKYQAEEDEGLVLVFQFGIYLIVNI
jgi:hypothetical protein